MHNFSRGARRVISRLNLMHGFKHGFISGFPQKKVPMVVGVMFVVCIRLEFLISFLITQLDWSDARNKMAVRINISCCSSDWGKLGWKLNFVHDLFHKKALADSQQKFHRLASCIVVIIIVRESWVERLGWQLRCLSWQFVEMLEMKWQQCILN